MRVYKYQLDFLERQTINLPKGATVLDVQCQGRRICLWALINPDEEGCDKFTYRVFGTGRDLPDMGNLIFVATVQDGPFVWHVFREKE